MFTKNSGFFLSVLVCGLFALGTYLTIQTIYLRRLVSTTIQEDVRVTVINEDGSVFYDTEGATGNHADREEVVNTLKSGKSLVQRMSSTTGDYLIYGAHKVGDKIVRLAIPYSGAIAPVSLAKKGLLAACGIGAVAALFLFILFFNLRGKFTRQAMELENATLNEKFRREFTANVTHELKTPLTSILGAVEMLNDGTPLADDERRDLLNIVHEQASRLNSLTKDILSLSQIEREQDSTRQNFIETPINKIIENVVSIERNLAKDSGTEINIIDNDPVSLPVDVHYFEQMISNLIENALRYSGSKTIDVSSLATRETVKISVSDYGVGIPPECLPHIFERFYRVDKARSRSVGGTGLGLAIVKHIAILHNGTVSVDSEQAVKTTFTISLKRDNSRQSRH